MSQKENIHKSAKTDKYTHHDYYGIDELLSEEHLMARDAVQQWV